MSKVKSKALLGLIITSLAALVALAACGYVYIQHANDSSALATTKKWARLIEFPVTATRIHVRAEGSLFTREFTVTFVAPLDDIETWLRLSPGTQHVKPEKVGTLRKYRIEPGGGAQHADLEVDEQTESVTIRVHWS